MKEDIHLEEEQIIRAIVDESDLSEAARKHLAACSTCGEKKQDMEKELRILGKLAQAYAPSPPRRMLLPEKEPSYFRLWTWQKTLLAGASAVAVLVLIVALWFRTPRIGTEKASLDIYRSASEEELLFMEARALEEDPLPPFHRFVIGGSYPVLNEGFMEFVSTSI
jgi:hypothetical protein